MAYIWKNNAGLFLTVHLPATLLIVNDIDPECQNVVVTVCIQIVYHYFSVSGWNTKFIPARTTGAAAVAILLHAWRQRPRSRATTPLPDKAIFTSLLSWATTDACATLACDTTLDHFMLETGNISKRLTKQPLVVYRTSIVHCCITLRMDQLVLNQPTDEPTLLSWLVLKRLGLNHLITRSSYEWQFLSMNQINVTESADTIFG